MGHKGHVTVARWFADEDVNVVLTGAQDGHVRVWDLRSREEVANIAAHTSAAGSGAVAAICPTAAAPASVDRMGGNVIVSAGADAAVVVLDPVAGFAERFRFTDHRCACGSCLFVRTVVSCYVMSARCTVGTSRSELAEFRERALCRTFVYALHVAGTLAFSGGGDGMLCVHDLEAGALLYALGANECVRARAIACSSCACRFGAACVRVYSRMSRGGRRRAGARSGASAAPPMRSW